MSDETAEARVRARIDAAVARANEVMGQLTAARRVAAAVLAAIAKRLEP